MARQRLQVRAEGNKLIAQLSQLDAFGKPLLDAHTFLGRNFAIEVRAQQFFAFLLGHGSSAMRREDALNFSSHILVNDFFKLLAQL